MLPTNENGQIITVYNLFHSLTTRLNLLRNGIKNKGEVKVEFKEVISEIGSMVYGYNPNEVLPLISIFLGNIAKIKESGRNIFERIHQEGWGISQQEEDEYIQNITIELNYYEDSLREMENELIEFELQYSEASNVSNLDKIPINITIPQLSWLVHFMVGNNDEFDKLFISEKREFCRKLITILKPRNGIDISLNSICNKWTDEDAMKGSLEFWRDRFMDYRTKCINTLMEKNLV